MLWRAVARCLSPVLLGAPTSVGQGLKATVPTRALWRTAPQLSPATAAATALFSTAAGPGRTGDGGKDSLSALFESALKDTRPEPPKRRPAAAGGLGIGNDTLVHEIQRATDIASLHKIMSQHSARLRAYHYHECWLKYGDMIHVPASDVKSCIHAIQVFIALQPHLCGYVQVRHTLEPVMWVCGHVQYIESSIYKVLGASYRNNKGLDAAARAGHLSVPAELYTQYHRLMGELVDTCDARMALEAWPRLVKDLLRQTGVDATPQYQYILQGFIRARHYKPATSDNKKYVCAALMEAMGQYTQSNANRTDIERPWEPHRYRPDTVDACILLDLQHAMREFGVPIAPLWREHMSEATYAALSCDRPALWTENHYRLCRAWQESGAADDDTPVAIKIARLMQMCDQRKLKARPYVAPGAKQHISKHSRKRDGSARGAWASYGA